MCSALVAAQEAERPANFAYSRSLSPDGAVVCEGIVCTHLQGVLFALRHHGRALIADEMGVGKTVQAIALMACYPVSSPRMGMACAFLARVWVLLQHGPRCPILAAGAPFRRQV